MEKLFDKFFSKVDLVPSEFTRYLMNKIDWNDRLIGIKGARGTGKTTLLLQYAKGELPPDKRTLYVSLDDIYFSDNSLVGLADEFVRQGGEYLLLDEVHRYRHWSAEIKNIFDDHPKLRIIFTGSSIIQLNLARSDLSRRAVMYELAGLSYREFINLKTGLSFKPFAMDKLLPDHTQIARSVTRQIKPYKYFSEYLEAGYYPYFLENPNTYHQKLAETIDLAMNTDLPPVFNISHQGIERLKQLLYVISESVPFQPNVLKLSERIGVTRNTLVLFFHYLDEMRIIKRLYSSAKGIGRLQKPEKILMHHPNLHYAIAPENAEKGSMRESFFVNQTDYTERIQYSHQGDFKIRNHIFEIGGKNKSRKQIKDIKEAYIVSDDIETGINNRIPLWLFGFLY